jgi:hypothetical protein
MKISGINKLIENEGFNMAISLFLDSFYHSKDKYNLIREELKFNVIDKNSCLIASIIHKLANDSNIKVPKWVNDDKYISKEPYFQFNTVNKEYQEFLKQNTPKEFKSRNVYFTENILSRV